MRPFMRTVISPFLMTLVASFIRLSPPFGRSTRTIWMLGLKLRRVMPVVLRPTPPLAFGQTAARDLVAPLGPFSADFADA